MLVELLGVSEVTRDFNSVTFYTDNEITEVYNKGKVSGTNGTAGGISFARWKNFLFI